MQTVSREELYKQVWQRPLMKVAADYNITGTALKKICDRHEIPTPERGYWAKLEFGKAVNHPSLPTASDVGLNQVRIVGTNYPALPQKVTNAKARVRDKLAESGDGEAASSGGSYDTADDAVRGIPSLAATLRAIRKASPDHEGFVAAKGRGVVPLRVAPASVDRSILLLAQFFSLADSQGFKPQATDEALVLVVDSEIIGFTLEAPTDRKPHQPTAAELKEQARHASWGMSREPWPKYDYFPSEKLSIVIQANAYSGLRKTFSDRQTRPLEETIPKVLEAFAEHAAFARHRREEQEESSRRYKEAERLRRLDEAFAAREKRRIEFAEAVHERLTERKRLEEVLQHLEGSVDTEKQADEMTTWLRRRIAQLSALIGPEFLDISARASKLSFSEPTPAPETSEYYYYPVISLQYWSTDETTGIAQSRSALQWLKESGLLRTQVQDHTE